MSVFLVVADPDQDEAIAAAVGKIDHQPVRPGVWLIRTKDKTSSDAARSIGVAGATPALVVTARFISGWAESDIIEQLEAWDNS